MLPQKLQHKLDQRKQDNALRHLGAPNDLVDFSSNDYLGFSKSDSIFKNAQHYLETHHLGHNGSTGSRLLSGNHNLYKDVENLISTFHKAETALIFNSGYDANLGFFSSVPQRNDIILYDEYCHASIRDGISMSHAKAFKFRHNDLGDLEERLTHLLQTSKNLDTEPAEVYLVTESVFSMDGDSPDLKTLVKLGNTYNAHIIIDEAHAVGMFGEQGNGLINHLNLETKIFARIITFGKALGSHGAAILGSASLKDFLINFSRPFIYTTALPPHSLATIKAGYQELKNTTQSQLLQQNIAFFSAEVKRLKLMTFQNDKISEEKKGFIESQTAIHCCIICGNDHVKHISELLQHEGFDVKAILSPTVPKTKERLRFCLHSYNTKKEITKVLELLHTFAF
ncbi:aminotransferase class I/II-fold pyridoxal phosphate-dependent enzyme [Psychroserpens sp.]|uniref:aminotransferase class I/II-fold pyridoxal phosphate-dependent enzyme n=1 Tax=Psychroserpens sp. TaxID=2020870 RepID=UPI003C76D89D